MNWLEACRTRMKALYGGTDEFVLLPDEVRAVLVKIMFEKSWEGYEYPMTLIKEFVRHQMETHAEEDPILTECPFQGEDFETLKSLIETYGNIAYNYILENFQTFDDLLQENLIAEFKRYKESCEVEPIETEVIDIMITGNETTDKDTAADMLNCLCCEIFARYLMAMYGTCYTRIATEGYDYTPESDLEAFGFYFEIAYNYLMGYANLVDSQIHSLCEKYSL